MVFASLEFLFAFLPLFFICYFGIGHFTGLPGKNIILLIFSLLFYAWGEPVYVLLMVYSTFLDYTCGRMIEKGTAENKEWLRKTFLIVSLIGNLGVLALFKYADFFANTANQMFSFSIPALGLTLPIGISFYTFQTMSYSIDVYRGQVKAQHNILYFGAYVVMFPQLIAGPVVRYSDVEIQLNDRTETFENVVKGMRRFLGGLAKKVLIANTMAQVCDSLFELAPERIGTLGAWIAILAYTFQIFFDFSGYSDMAIGLGLMMGFYYPENFRYPYISRSISEFWRRWHITMSTFFRDYVYIPMGGNRVHWSRWLLNVLVVWSLTGLWHGASWNFVLWGLYFAVILVLEKFLLGKFLNKSHVLSRVYSIALIIYGWVIFNAVPERGGLTWLSGFTKALFGGFGAYGTSVKSVFYDLLHSDVNTIFFITFFFAIIFSIPFVPYLEKKLAAKPKAMNVFVVVGDVFLCACLLYATAQLAIGSYNPFIYFRF